MAKRKSSRCIHCGGKCEDCDEICESCMCIPAVADVARLIHRLIKRELKGYRKSFVDTSKIYKTLVGR